MRANVYYIRQFFFSRDGGEQSETTVRAIKEVIRCTSQEHVTGTYMNESMESLGNIHVQNYINKPEILFRPWQRKKLYINMEHFKSNVVEFFYNSNDLFSGV